MEEGRVIGRDEPEPPPYYTGVLACKDLSDTRPLLASEDMTRSTDNRHENTTGEVNTGRTRSTEQEAPMVQSNGSDIEIRTDCESSSEDDYKVRTDGGESSEADPPTYTDFDWADKFSMWSMNKEGDINQEDIARMYNTNRPTISKCVTDVQSEIDTIQEQGGNWRKEMVKKSMRVRKDREPVNDTGPCIEDGFEASLIRTACKEYIKTLEEKQEYADEDGIADIFEKQRVLEKFVKEIEGIEWSHGVSV